MSEGTASPGTTQDPQVISNPPGRSQISYRVDDFTGFRRAMLRPLPGEQAIGAWQPAKGDLGLQVLEWWAYLADVLTFYNERIANENYLRTATRPGSVANLVALLGYEPAPGIAATGSVAAIRSGARPDEPLVIPAGMPLSSVATPGVPAQTFEAGTAASFTGPSTVPVTLPPDTSLAINSDGTPQSVLLAGQPGGVKAGDQLLLVKQGFTGADDNWSLVTVGALTPVTDPGTGAVNTLITFSAGGWGPTPTPPPFPELIINFPPLRFLDEIAAGTPGPVAAESLARESLAPVTRMFPGTRGGQFVIAEGFHWTPRMSPPPGPGSSPQSTSYRLMRPTTAAALWTSQSPDGADQQVIEQNAAGPPLTVRLSAAVRAISPGDMVLFDGGPGAPSALAVVAGAAEELWVVPYPSAQSPKPNPPTIVVTHTALTLTLAVSDTNALLDVADLTTVAVRYGFKDVGTIIGVPAPNLPSLPAGVGVPTSYTPPSLPATAFLQGATGGGVLVTVTAAGPGQVTLTGTGSPPTAITTPLPVPLQLLLDVVPVSRGKTVTGEVLGSGNAALANQAFTLSKSPLTYLASGNGAVPALAVYVDGVEWQQVPSFYGQAANAQVFVVSRSPDQTVTTVTFGDGVNGAKLTSGTGNVVATYRYGSGAASPPAGRLTTIGQPQPNLASIQNPVAVSGGTDPQAIQDVRTNAPASVFTFGRAVSATDYEVVASQAPGVSRVAAYWTFDGTQQRTLVTIYVGGDQGAAAAARAALAGSEDPNRPVTVASATAIDLTLNCTLVVAADRQLSTVVAAATAAVSDTADGPFSPARMHIGQRLYRSAIDAALMVPGVVAVHDLTVIRPFPVFGGRFLGLFRFEQALGEYFDPGEGAFFDLPPGNVAIVGVSASG
jgi:hypothetical protein